MTEGKTNSASTTGGDVRADLQDPLPEPNWLWRRSYTFALSLISLGFVWYGAEAMFLMKRPEELFAITRYMIGILAFLILCYMVAPSAEQITKLVQASKIIQSGVPMSRTAEAETDEGKTKITATVGDQSGALAEPEPYIAPEDRDPEDFAPRSRT